MKQPIDIIVDRHPLPWIHIPTGEIHYVVFAAPLEVVTYSENGAWLGRAVEFIREFAAVWVTLIMVVLLGCANTPTQSVTIPDDHRWHKIYNDDGTCAGAVWTPISEEPRYDPPADCL